MAQISVVLAIVAFPALRCEAQANQIRQLTAKNKLLANFYGARNFQPAWGPDHLRGLVTFLQGLDSHGLDSNALFNFAQWQPHLLNPAGVVDPQLDVNATHLALFAIQSLAYGYVDPTQVHPKWRPINRAVTAPQFLDQALQQPTGQQMARFLLARVSPPDNRYQDMVKTLARYRKIQSFGGWKPLPNPGRPIGPGMPYRDLDLLKARLQAEGDLPSTAPVRNKKNIVEKLTSDALKSFQFRHGITPDGFIGPNTLKELNHSAQDRIDTLIINLDRLRWMPRSWEQAEHVEVNIAESALRVYQNRRRITTMEVIVGVKGKHQTPVFHGDIKFLIFRPYWNVPPKIARNELVPEALQGNFADYMLRNSYEIVSAFGVAPEKALPVNVQNLNKVAEGSLLMRQSTGPKNALGLVKFIFPNDSSVYLHDTPNRALFQQADRDLSHGCVRVSRPDELANIVLQRNNQGWDLRGVQAAMNDASNPNHKVNLARPLPVYLMYWSAYIMGDGRVRFDQDIYGHDVTMKRLLRLRP